MAEEYFIRGPEEETAKGPYSIDALLTLAEAGKISPDDYYFDPDMESWARINANEELYSQVFPEKKSLSLRKKTAEEIRSINIEDGDKDSVKVEEMLAAAEGLTSDTRHVRRKKEWEGRTASMVVPLLGTLLLISALSVLYPSWNIIQGILNETEGSWQLLFQQPVVFLGALDLLMGAFLFLNATEVFPLIRFRAMLGAGFFFILYMASWINGDPQAIWMAISYVGFGFGLFVCTVTLNFPIMVIAAVAGYAGAISLIWYSNLVPLFFS